MYRRYSQMGDGSMPLSQVNRNRIKNIVIFVLLVALAVMTVISVPLMRNRDNNRALYIRQMQKESKEALNDSLTLSRTAGADSSAILARIRSNIHTIRAISSLSGAEGERLMEDERLLTLQNMVDKYLQYLSTGMDTGEYSTTLQNALTELQDILNTLT